MIRTTPLKFPHPQQQVLVTTTVLLLLLLFQQEHNHHHHTNTIFIFANALGDKKSSQPLFESTATDCDDMLHLHRWEGSCCSLNKTAGNGCILNVMNGNCIVKGQEWTLNYVSTYDEVQCPPSEYSAEQLGTEDAVVVSAAAAAEKMWSAPAIMAAAAAASLLAMVLC